MFDAKRVINGTYGEVWLNNKNISEATGLELKIAFDKADVKQCGTLINGSKITGAKCTGSLKMNKISSYLAKILSDMLKKGSFPEFTVISNLKDPDALGAERIKVTGVLFDEAILANWAAGTLQEDTYPFTFTGFDFIDYIKG